MRCDYPMGYDEDYLEPACEIFLQLFLQNAQIAANEELSQDNEGVVNADFEIGYESDDNFSFPSLHTISDASLSTEELSGDEVEDIIISTISEESINPEDFDDGTSTIDLASDSPENDSAEGYQFVEESTDVPSENHQSSKSSLIVNSQDSDTISNVAFQETDDCADISTSNLSPSNEPFSEESTVEINISSSNNIASTPSTFVSLFVVVPPTSFSHESDNLLSEVSSDRLFSDNIPVNSPSPSLVVSDNRNIASEHESLHTVNKICDNSEELIPDSSAVCNSFSVTENDKKHHMSEFNSALDGDNSISPENTVGFDENSHSEFVSFDAHLSEEANMHQDETTSCDVTSDKSVQNLKRKGVSSVDDDLINKVPKYSQSNESINEVSVDNYSKELSNDSEMSLLCDEDKVDIVPSTVSVENVILPLGKTVDENSVTEQQKDL